MANWESKKMSPNEVNNGKQYNTYDGLTANDINAIVKGLLYAQEKTSDIQYIRIDDNIYNTDFFISYLNNYNINLTDYKNQTVCFESYSGTDYYDYFVFLTNYDNEAILLCDGGVFNISYSINGYKKYNIVQKVTGDLANLQNGIMDKDNLVSAINYTYNATLFNSSNIDTINQTIGSKSNLQTTDKTNLVNAINEILHNSGTLIITLNISSQEHDEAIANYLFQNYNVNDLKGKVIICLLYDDSTPYYYLAYLLDDDNCELAITNYMSFYNGIYNNGWHRGQHIYLPNLESKETIGVLTNLKTTDKSSIVSAINSLIPYHEITYSELKLLRDNSNLSKGHIYRITDYVTKTKTSDEYMSAEHPFDILVRAVSENELDENATAMLHSGDTYFSNSNIASWVIKYNIDNDTNLYEWANSENGKGVIYYMKDSHNNELPYDFKNILFKRYKITDVTTIPKNTGTYNQFIGWYGAFDNAYGVTYDTTNYKWLYTFNKLDEEPIDVSDSTEFAVVNNKIEPYYTGTNFNTRALNNMVFTLSLSKNGFIPDQYYVMNECKDNTFKGECHHWTILGGDFTQNTIEACSRYNIIGKIFNHNVCGSDFQYNLIAPKVRFNRFGEDFEHNTVGMYCLNNSFDTVTANNIFRNYFKRNTLSAYVTNNTFGESNIKNIFGTNIENNTIGNNVEECNFENSMSYCSIPNNAKAITIQTKVKNIVINNQVPLQACGNIVIASNTDTSTALTISNNTETKYYRFNGSAWEYSLLSDINNKLDKSGGTIEGNLSVREFTTLNRDTTIDASLTVNDNITSTGTVYASNAEINGDVTINGSIMSPDGVSISKVDTLEFLDGSSMTSAPHLYMHNINISFENYDFDTEYAYLTLYTTSGQEFTFDTFISYLITLIPSSKSFLRLGVSGACNDQAHITNFDKTVPSSIIVHTNGNWQIAGIANENELTSKVDIENDSGRSVYLQDTVAQIF